MEISDCIWDEGFPLTVEELGDLEESLSTSIDSPVLVPFQWAGGPLADEADKADMTPQCMPVIDPNFVRENLLEGCIIDGVSDVISGGDDILTDYLIGQESCDIFRCLHILVCGFCHSVYHTIDEFRSHIITCNGSQVHSSSVNNFETNICDRNNIDNCGSSNHNCCDTTKQAATTSHNSSSDVVTSGLALVLWTSTVMRRVRSSLSFISPDLQADLSARIQAKWTTLDIETKQVWEKAAEALQELARVGSLVFPEQQLSQQQNQLSQQLNYSSCQYIDEIELPTQHININNDVFSRRLLNSGKVKSKEKKNYTSPKDHSKNEMTKSNCDTMKRNNQSRGRNGRWLKPFNEDIDIKPAEFTCSPCRFRTNNSWKFCRHRETVKHLQLIRNSENDASSVVKDIMENDTITDKPTEYITNDSAIETGKPKSNKFEYLHKNIDVNKGQDVTTYKIEDTDNEIKDMDESAVLQHNHETVTSNGFKIDDGANKENGDKSKVDIFSDYKIDEKEENNNKEGGSKPSSDQESVNSMSVSKQVFNKEVSTSSTENDDKYVTLGTQRNNYEKANYNGNNPNESFNEYYFKHQSLPLPQSLSSPTTLQLTNGFMSSISNSTNNTDRTMVAMKRKIEAVGFSTMPGKRATSKRSSALTASKRMHDWTSILSKR